MLERSELPRWVDPDPGGPTSDSYTPGEAGLNVLLLYFQASISPVLNSTPSPPDLAWLRICILPTGHPVSVKLLDEVNGSYSRVPGIEP